MRCPFKVSTPLTISSVLCMAESHQLRAIKRPSTRKAHLPAVTSTSTCRYRVPISGSSGARKSLYAPKLKPAASALPLIHTSTTKFFSSCNASELHLCQFKVDQSAPLLSACSPSSCQDHAPPSSTRQSA